MTRKLLIAAAFLTAGLVTAALAQTIEGLDLGAIQNRAEEQAKDAQAFLDSVAGRGDAAREDARQIADDGMGALKAIDTSKLPKVAGADGGAVDLDELVTGARGALEAPKSAPLFIAFASLSMPEESLKRMIADVHKAGGVVVLRGLPANSGRTFATAMRHVMSQDAAANVAIDPRLFRAFNIQAAPTYVTVSTSFAPCDDFACKTAVPPSDRIVGNVTVQYALETFVDAKGPGAPAARVALANLTRRD
ncbi:type-F conjugative transfer system pilin assembly protein TrbC [Novosphingobium sp. 9U]|uniref:type-F conjugative transfer system pilin assembly protein TrbC n=1 Tax=Novosphingobium sp. 9U TaxID=2653158 RepID=UPI0012F0F9C6|nr:type-F conjugative transfer system pilin assembly protein TrbC [Novosphingobium sp. 9U]VWX49853.1 Type-F conjugative transfer system pilin assembly protein TrbC [Novosphingobium sp. 9U]